MPEKPSDCVVCLAIETYELLDLNDRITLNYMAAQTGVSGTLALTRLINESILLSVLKNSSSKYVSIYIRYKEIYDAVYDSMRGVALSPPAIALLSDIQLDSGLSASDIYRHFVDPGQVQRHVRGCLQLSRENIVQSEQQFIEKSRLALEPVNTILTGLLSRAKRKDFGDFSYSIVAVCRKCGARIPIDRVFVEGFRHECHAPDRGL
jgi:hypothetical protein